MANKKLLMSVRTVNDDPSLVLDQIVQAMQDKKAKQIVSLDLSGIPNAVTKYFVICHAPSKTQVDAIYENILEFVLNNNGVKPFNKEGRENSEWILIDYVDVVAHVFLEDIRTFYHLEDLWADAKLKTYESDD
jgi:ribosome-associated protein